MKKILLILFLLTTCAFVPQDTRATVAENAARDAYVGNGSSTGFPYTFRILDQTEIAVYVNGVAKALTTDFTVSGVGNAAGGTVTFLVAPTAGFQVLFLRANDIVQGSVYTPNEAFPATRVERDLDRQAMINQQQEEKIARSLHYPITTTPTTGLTQLPTPVADKCLGYDNAGTSLQMNDCTGGSGEVSTHAALTTAHGSTDANTASRIVQRDASGNFSAGTITATLSGNASTASALAANPANCTNSFPRGVTAAGVSEDCDQIEATDISNNAVGAAAVDETDDFEFSGTMFAETTFAALPAAGTGRFRWVTDCESATACSVGGGSTRGLVYDDGVSWVLIGSSGATPTLDTVMTAGNTTSHCTEASPCKFGNGTTYVNIYANDANQMVVEPSTAADRFLTCMTNQNCGFYDTEGAAAILTIDPDAASALAMYTFGTAYKPVKTIDFPAAALTTDTAQCASPALATINSGAPRYTIVCTDNDGSSIYGEVLMPNAWDGGTVTFTHRYVQTAADTGVLNGDIATACRLATSTINATFGTEVAIDDAAVTGSNAIDMTTSSAVTANGTCTAGVPRLLQFRYQLDAGGTTTAVATLHHLGFTLRYSVTSFSD